MGGSNSVLSTIGHVLSGVTQVYSAGTINPDKHRVNVPFTSAQVREVPKGVLGMYSGGKLNNQASRIFDAKLAQTLGTVGAAIEGSIAGAGVGSALSTPAAVAGSSAGAAGGASTAVVPSTIAGVTPALGVAGTAGGAAAGGASTAAVTSGIAGTAPAGFGAAAPAAAGSAFPFSSAALGTGAAAAGTAGAAYLTGTSPALPPPPIAKPITLVDTSAQDAAHAVQTAAAEARRVRAAKRQSTVLSNYQGHSATGISPATLQPGPPRRSVLG